MNAYAVAANAAEEALGGIRTVVSLCGQKIESKRYDRLLEPARVAGKRKGLFSGVFDGLIRLLLFGSVSIGFWYGFQLVLYDRDKIDKEYTPGVLLIVSTYIMQQR